MAKMIIVEAPDECPKYSKEPSGVVMCWHINGPEFCSKYNKFPKRCPLQDAPTDSAVGKPQEPAERTLGGIAPPTTQGDEICPSCNGKGAYYKNHSELAVDCSKCGGSGKLSPVA